jgi:hypothetical protein
MGLIEQLIEFISHPGVFIVGAVTLFEIAPIKINPWKSLFKWIGKMINGELQKDLSELKKDFEETKAQNKRWQILEFSRSCREGVRHSREEWKHAISEVAEYEAYTKKKNIVNGVIEEDAKYIRELYKERNMQNDFL